MPKGGAREGMSRVILLTNTASWKAERSRTHENFIFGKSAASTLSIHNPFIELINFSSSVLCSCLIGSSASS